MAPAGGAVEGHLDGQHLGVLGGGAQEALDRGAEGLVGVLEQDGPVLADDVEDVAPVVGQQRVVHRAVGCVVELRDVEAGDLEEVAHAPSCPRPRRRPAPRSAPVPPPACRGGPGPCRPGPPGARWGRNGARAVRSRSAPAGRWRPPASGSTMALRVTRNSAQESISMPGKSMSRLSTIRSSRVTKVVLAVQLDQALGHVLAHRDLDPGHVGLAAAGVAQGHQQVERQVGDKGEGVRRVHGQRREHREDVGARSTRAGVRGRPASRSLTLTRRMPLVGQQRHQVIEDPLLVRLRSRGPRARQSLDLLGWGCARPCSGCARRRRSVASGRRCAS